MYQKNHKTPNFPVDYGLFNENVKLVKDSPAQKKQLY